MVSFSGSGNQPIFLTYIFTVFKINYRCFCQEAMHVRCGRVLFPEFVLIRAEGIPWDQADAFLPGPLHGRE